MDAGTEPGHAGAAPGPAHETATSDVGHETATPGLEDPDAESLEKLRVELVQLRRAMQTRPTIDLARGILMASFGLTADDAWTVLVATSQNTNTKLHHLARDLITAVRAPRSTTPCGSISPPPCHGWTPQGGEGRHRKTQPSSSTAETTESRVLTIDSAVGLRGRSGSVVQPFPDFAIHTHHFLGDVG
ncbi:hypothetical protein GCM10020256_03040 [Streptomyces thermocoprophilus]